MKYSTEHLWEQGLRNENEDSIAVMHIIIGNTPAILAIVADGIGGMSYGETASGMVVNRIKCAFENLSYTPDNFKPKTLKHTIKRELYACHTELTGYGIKNNLSIGTTVSLICIIGRRGFLIHSGDSRIYICSKRFKHPKLITSDQNTPSGYLTNCIGHGNNLKLITHSFLFTHSSKLLLCTDGFYRRLQPEIYNMQHLLRLHTPKDLLQYMNSLAISRGESDNSSAILIQLTK